MIRYYAPILHSKRYHPISCISVLAVSPLEAIISGGGKKPLLMSTMAFWGGRVT